MHTQIQGRAPHTSDGKSALSLPSKKNRANFHQSSGTVLRASPGSCPHEKKINGSGAPSPASQTPHRLKKDSGKIKRNSWRRTNSRGPHAAREKGSDGQFRPRFEERAKWGERVSSSVGNIVIKKLIYIYKRKYFERQNDCPHPLRGLGEVKGSGGKPRKIVFQIISSTKRRAMNPCMGSHRKGGQVKGTSSRG